MTSPLFEMRGKHWLGTCRECQQLEPAMIHHVVKSALQTCGATIVSYQEHIFPKNQAVTMCFLLQESHCTIHTYPEYQALWMDCFTCGETFDLPTFIRLIQQGLGVGSIHEQLIYRT